MNLGQEDIIRACFLGFGMSPEIAAIMLVQGMRNAGLPDDARFGLHDIDRFSWELRHSRSLSREDVAEEAGVDLPPSKTSLFSRRAWDVSLAVLTRCGEVTDAPCLGKARAARVRDGSRGPSSVTYDTHAAGHGAVESAMIILTLGNRFGVRRSYLASIFEREKLPSDLGWRPKAFSAALLELLQVAVDNQTADKILRCTTNGRVASAGVRFILTRVRRTRPINQVT